MFDPEDFERVADETIEVLDDFEETLIGRAIDCWADGDHPMSLGAEDLQYLHTRIENVMKCIFRCTGAHPIPRETLRTYPYTEIIQSHFSDPGRVNNFFRWINGDL